MKLTQRLCAVFASGALAVAANCQAAEPCGPGQSGSGRHGHCEECDDWSFGDVGHMNGYTDARPVGARQRWQFGRVWPPFPRPTGPQQNCAQQYHAAHYWPHPYVCQDRQSVFEHTQAMVENGWIDQTTMHEYHFNDEEGLLNHAGEAHLRWILYQAPERYRAVWVQTGRQSHVTDMRLQAVQLAAAEMVGPDHVPQIMPRACLPISTPAQEVDIRYRSWIQSVPAPRIQYTPLGSPDQN